LYEDNNKYERIVRTREEEEEEEVLGEPIKRSASVSCRIFI